ncbi:MAG: alpha-galactosidase [Defluviitaleaceae bacterium]|nr:alpha-galactosidase [Defluviitaleaceae bacterium]
MSRLKNVAHLPPKGWNSWDCYGASVTEDEVLGNAEYMAKHLLPHGWEYVVVDIQWYEPTARSSIYNAFAPLEMDGHARLMPAVNRFPSAAGGKGFAPLGEKIHAMGLKFGIHMMRGIPRQAVHANTPILGTNRTARDIAANNICPWNSDMYGVNPAADGAQAYYDSLFALYASWGVDFVKVDDIATSRLYPFFREEIEMLRLAIDRCGRDMVLSLSPGPAPLEHAAALKQNANMWRMTDDYWDKWHYLKGMFERCAKWWPLVGDHGWPDCDMLPLGHIGIRSVDGNWPHPWEPLGANNRQTRFTRDEQRTMMVLWTIFRSPMFFGGELRDNDDWTLALLTDPLLVEMHREIRKSWPEGSGNKDVVIWRAEGVSADYVARFNIGEVPVEGIPPHGVILERVVK